jgi:pyridoxine 5'-phosphate synthase PdxJ
MNTDNLIRIEFFCEQYNVELAFINSLHEFGLINVMVVEDSKYLSHEDLKGIEKLVRLHYELGINMEGIDVISNLLHQIADLQQELTAAKNKTRSWDLE